MGAAPHVATSIELHCVDARDRFACAARVQRFAAEAGFDARRAREVAICAAELASNAARHGGGGTLTATVMAAPRAGIELTCFDRGGGIAEPALAMVDGWSRGAQRAPDDPRFDGLGAGLGAARRMTDELEIGARPGGGTLIRARKWL